MRTSSPAEVFISYSYKDEELFKQFEKYLRVLARNGKIRTWHGRKIPPGDKWEEVIDERLKLADLVLLLVSVDFLVSEYCFSVEFEGAKKRQAIGATRIIPIILHPCPWPDTPIAMFQVLPRDGEPIASSKDTATAFLNVTNSIRELVESSGRKHFKRITISSQTSQTDFNVEDFTVSLREDVGVNLDRIAISVHRGSDKVIIEGDDQELHRILNALGDPAFRGQITGGADLKSITYIQDDYLRVIPLDPKLPIKPAEPRHTLTSFFKSAIRAVPAVKYALLLAAIATGVVVVAGLGSNYKIAGLGIVTMFLLMFCLVLFSRSVRDSAPPTRTTALALSWLFIGLTVITSVCIITGFFISWPQPLEAYFYFSTPTPEVQITITEVPPYDPVGGGGRTGRIAGKVSGLKTNDYYVVIYSFTLTWYVQPTTANPKTKIKPDGTWEAEIQLGSKYAALVVPPDYNPPYTMKSRPVDLSGITAAVEVEGKR